MHTIAHTNQKNKSTRDSVNDIFPTVPPDPLIEIGRDVKAGFTYAIRCLRSINRMRKEIAKVNREMADLRNRQRFLEDLLIQREQN